MAGLKVIVPPAAEPVTLAELKAQLRIDTDDTDYDDILSPLIPAAREWCEGYQNRAYMTQTLELALDAWPCGDEIKLPRPPLQSVTSLVYTDSEGASTTWDASNYIVDDYAFVARLVRARNVNWPGVCLATANGVKVRFVAGQESADGVPQRVKQAIILLAGCWFESGIGADPPDAVRSLLALDRVVPI